MSTPTGPRVTLISCDDCIMRRTTACRDCVVSYLLTRDGEPDVEFDLDADDRRAVELLAKAGLVPRLRHELVS